MTAFVSTARRLLAALGLAAAGAAQAGIVFADDSMATALLGATPAFASPGVTLTTTTVGGQLQTTTGNMTGQTGYGFLAGYLYSGFTYDPASTGAITSIDLSIARGAEVLRNGVAAAGLTLTGRALIEQGGQYYMSVSAPVAPLALPGLTSITDSGLTAASFGLVDWATGAIDATLNPDFNGTPMHFGFAARLFIADIAASDVVSMSAWSDAFRLTLSTASVPEPGSLALAVLALLALQRAGSAARRSARRYSGAVSVSTAT